LGEVSDGLVVVTLVEVGGATAAIGDRRFRIKLDGLTVIGDGAINIALFGVRDAAVDIR
jgi:hypothetical protein